MTDWDKTSNLSFGFDGPSKDKDKDSNNLTNPKAYNEAILKQQGYITDLFYKGTQFLSNVLSTSKGRNKICSLIQYQAKLVYTCETHSNIPEIAEMVSHLKNPKKVLLSGRIYATMSKHRKIFNLFKFVDEISKIEKSVKSKSTPTYLKILETLSSTGAIFYYVFDNFLWLVFSNIRKIVMI